MERGLRASTNIYNEGLGMDRRKAYEALLNSVTMAQPSHTIMVKDTVSVYIKDGKLIKNRNGSIDEDILTALAINSGDIAIEVEGTVVIYTNDKNKYSMLLIKLITVFGVDILDKFRIIERR